MYHVSILISLIISACTALGNISFPKPVISCIRGKSVSYNYPGCPPGMICGGDNVCHIPKHTHRSTRAVAGFSTNGRCGFQGEGLMCDPDKNSPDYVGPCCSAFGYCGVTPAHCDRVQGCQSGCGSSTNIGSGTISVGTVGGVTRDGRCGRDFGGSTCEGWSFGTCCSSSGYCGITPAHCDVMQGCQSGCQSKRDVPGPSPPAQTLEPQISAAPITGQSVNGAATTDGTCGSKNGGTVCGNWSLGSCCSMYGFCGSTSAHCGIGCQSNCRVIGSNAPGPRVARTGTDSDGFKLAGTSGVPAMHAALLSNGNVVFIDKVENYTQLQLPDGQYAYSSEWNPQTFELKPLAYKTNAFCSGGAFLADGRLVNIGGNGPLEAVDSTVTGGFRGLRFLSSDGQNWVETDNIKLNTARWYASAQTLGDGRIFVASGSLNGLDPTVKSNNNPTYEILSAGGVSEGNSITMDILAHNQPYYMYPFIHLLRSGELFVFVSKESQIFNIGSNTVTTTMPELAGDFRTYPNTGTSVLLPLRNIDAWSAHILVCGGGSYQDITSPTDPSCGRINPEEDIPTWEMDSMPEGRTMVEGVLLADGKVLFVNGANKGAQGFGLAADPTFAPLLYDWTQNLGQRWTQYPATNIPRLYHSVALLLRDGTVLISGSNPVEEPILTANAGNPYVTDFRNEIWTPPYLSGGNAKKRPTNVALRSNVMAANGGLHYVSFQCPTQTQNVDINIYHGGFVTHSLHMGARLVHLDSYNFKKGAASQSIHFRMPPSTNQAPPGTNWLLFVLCDGIPSVGVGFTIPMN